MNILALTPFRFDIKNYPELNQKIIEIPVGIESYYKIISHYLVRGRIIESLTFIENLILFVPDTDDYVGYKAVFHLLLGRLKHRLGNYSEAEFDYHLAISKGNKTGFIIVQISSCLNLSELYLSQGLYEQTNQLLRTSRNLLKIIIKTRQSSNIIKQWQQLRYVDLIQIECRLFVKRRQFSWAEARIIEIENLCKKKASDTMLKLALCTSKGFKAHHQGNYGLAIDYFKSGLGYAYEYKTKAGLIFQIEIWLAESLFAIYTIQQEEHQFTELKEILNRIDIFAKENHLFSVLPPIVMLQCSLKKSEYDYQGAIEQLNQLEEYIHSNIGNQEYLMNQINEYRESIEERRLLLRKEAKKQPEADIKTYLNNIKVAIQGQF
ncbi:MAG: hypothetical protein ACXAC7_03755 [Candidatus Hodarchaeales archaeon]